MNKKFVGVSASSYLGRVSREARYPRAGPAVVNQWEEVRMFLSVLGLASFSCEVLAQIHRHYFNPLYQTFCLLSKQKLNKRI